jgi:putative transposase
MSRYRRLRIPGGCYFFTVCLERRGSEGRLVRHVDALREAVRAARPFHIDAWVVLPDHMHAVWTLPPGNGDYAERWRLIKWRFSRAVLPDGPLAPARQARGERGLWQRRYWEHAIRDDEDYARHVDYVHVNPLKHGLVARVADWPHSSFHRCVARGVYPPDWAGGDVGDLDAGEPA